MILKVIRQVLGRLILVSNFVCPPCKKKRPPSEQEIVDQKTQKIKLYQFHMCPFCVRVRRTIRRLNLNIVCYDVNTSKEHESALIAGGGKRKVPCLRIEEDGKVTWLYESVAINNYLTKRFG
jgi:glutaredoxin